MAKSIKVRPKRGRPATGRDPSITVRLPPKVFAAVDKFLSERPDTKTRGGAIRLLVFDHLIGLGFLESE